MPEFKLPILNVSGYRLEGDGVRPEKLGVWGYRRRNAERKINVSKSGAGLLLRMGIEVGSESYEALGLRDPRDTLHKKVSFFAALPNISTAEDGEYDGPWLSPVLDDKQFVTGVSFQGEGLLVNPEQWRRMPLYLAEEVERDLQIRGCFDPSGARWAYPPRSNAATIEVH